MLDDIKEGHPVETTEGYPIEVLKIFDGSHGTLIAGIYRVGQGEYVSGLWDDVGSALQDHPDLELREMAMDLHWDLIHEDITHVVMDQDGDLVLFKEEPELGRHHWLSDEDNWEVTGLVKLLKTPYDPVNWKFSLTERP